MEPASKSLKGIDEVDDTMLIAANEMLPVLAQEGWLAMQDRWNCCQFHSNAAILACTRMLANQIVQHIVNMLGDKTALDSIMVAVLANLHNFVYTDYPEAFTAAMAEAQKTGGVTKQ